MLADEAFQEYLVLGPLTRYAEDLPFFMKVLSGPNASKLKLDEKVDLNKLNVFFMENLDSSICLPVVDAEIKKSIQKAVTHFRENTKAKITKVFFFQVMLDLLLRVFLFQVNFQELHDALEICTPVFTDDLKDMPNLLKDPKNPKVRFSSNISLIPQSTGFAK